MFIVTRREAPERSLLSPMRRLVVYHTARMEWAGYPTRRQA